MALTSDPVSVLCDLADSGVDRLPASFLERQYGVVIPFLARIGALTPGGPQASVVCQQCDQDHSSVVEFDPRTARHFYFCGEAGRIEVSDTEIATLCLDPEWLADRLQQDIPVIPPIRRRTLAAGRAWGLGEAVVGGVVLTVIFARGISAQEDLAALSERLPHLPHGVLGIVVTTTTQLAEPILRQHGYFPLDLREIMRAEADRLYLDRARFALWVKGFLKGMRGPARDRPGRPSQKDLVLQIHRERREQRRAETSVTAEARGIRAEIQSRQPEHEPPAVATILRHLRSDSS